MRYFRNILILSFSVIFSQQFGGASDPAAFEGIDLKNPYGVEFPFDTKISYKNNRNIPFESIFNNNDIPKLFVLGYYDCEAMCSAIREILFSQLQLNNDIRLGIDYEIVMLSIDHEEDILLAQKQEEIYFNRYFSNDYDESAKDYITFAVSTKSEIEEFANRIGFEYRYNENYEKQKNDGRQKYDHPSFVYIVSDKGLITSGTTSGHFGKEIKEKLVNAKNNSPSMDFDQLYSLTCLKGNIENKNPQQAFDLVQLASTWFVLNVGFGFGYNYLSRKNREEA